MNATEIKAIQVSLLEQKSAILNKSHELRTQQTSRGPLPDEADSAALNMTDSLSFHMHERDRQTLFRIERALSKISDGSYGLCEGCGCKIEPRRLQVHPFSTLCIECMEEQESHTLQ